MSTVTNQSEIARLKQENARLVREVATRGRKIADVQSKLRSKEQTIQFLQSHNQALMFDKEVLIRENNTMQAAMERLRGLRDMLQAEIACLRRELTMISSVYNHLCAHFQSLGMWVMQIAQ
jgi:chromosome segregation ATPase